MNQRDMQTCADQSKSVYEDGPGLSPVCGRHKTSMNLVGSKKSVTLLHGHSVSAPSRGFSFWVWNSAHERERGLFKR
jgi:hypothetical protein